MTSVPGRDIDAVEVGWNGNFNCQLPWIAMTSAQSQSKGMGGDSGGPIFAGRAWGRQDDPHRVVGIQSQENAASGWAVALRAPAIRAWLCARLSGTYGENGPPCAN